MDLPGCIYQRKDTGGWYWKVRPGNEPRYRFIPLRLSGQKKATTSEVHARAIAKAMHQQWQKAGASTLSTEKMLADFKMACAAHSSAGNAEQYARAARRFLADVGTNRLWEITAAMIQDYLAKMVQARCPATVKRHRAALSQLYQWAMLRGMVDHNPVRAVRPPKVYVRPPRYLTPDQVQMLLDALADAPTWLRNAVRVGLALGLRLTEIRRLRGHDLQRRDGATVLMVGSVDPTKTYRYRLLPFPADLLDIPWPEGDAFAFPDHCRDVWIVSLRDRTKDLPLFGKHPSGGVGNQWHLLRSTWAMNKAMEKPSLSIFQLMALGGWATTETVLRYVNAARAAGME